MWRKTEESPIASSPSPLSSASYSEQKTVRLAMWDDRGLQVSESSIVGAFAGISYSLHNQNYAKIHSSRLLKVVLCTTN